MMKDTDNGLSWSTSQNDQSGQSIYLRNQSSCSSLTSGIGHSDHSICNDREAAEQVGQPIPRRDKFRNIPLNDEPVTPSASNTQQNGCPRGSDVGEDLKMSLRNFVDIIFTDSQSVSLEKKAEFGKLMQTPEARLLFAMSVDDYRVNSKRVSELTFYSLAQYFSIVLLECLLAEDFRPAKIIMNMMFTYYYEQNYERIPPSDRPQFIQSSQPSTSSTSYSAKSQETCNEPRVVRTYLYTLLKDQQIFKSIRFWTSAFYESVMIERNNHPVFIDKQRGKSNEKRLEEMDCSKNITFGLLGSFIHNMCLLELSHEFCQEFFDKHSTIAGLSDDQLDMLRCNLKSMFSETSKGDKVPMSQATAGERLSSFLQKWSSKLNQSSNINTNQ